MLKMTYKIPTTEIPDMVDHILLEYRNAWGKQSQELSAEIMQHLRKVTPKSKGPGPHLADAYQAEFEFRGDLVKRIVWSNVSPHSYVLDFLAQGTRPHMIYGNPVLAFEWSKAGGKTVIVAHVHHPGTKAMSPTIDQSAQEILEKRINEIQEMIAEAINVAIGAK